MRKGLCVVSKIHKTKHQFLIVQGEVDVISENEGTVNYKAVHFGITLPNTRRVLRVNKDTIWYTFHPGPWQTVEEVEESIIEKHDNLELAYERVLQQLTI